MRAAAVVRILTGLLFAAGGYAKVTGLFVRGGFAKSAADMAREGFPFWKRFLEWAVLPHASAWGWIFAVAELAVGIALLLGVLTRIACAGGMVLMLLVMLGSAYAGPGAPWHGWITAGLTAKFAFLLFLILFGLDAGKVWGLDARLRRRPRLRRV